MKITNDGQDGVNVVDYVVNDSASPSIFIAEWRKNRPLCKTEADWDVFKAELTEIYSLYSIQDILAETASLQEVMLL
jgi:hypothetical protein